MNEKSTLERYCGNFYQGNYIYAAAMNLAWNELVQKIIGQNIELNTDDAAALKTTEIFNSAPFSTQDLDPESYYVKSGFGQKTVDAINQEVTSKFPNKSFNPLQLLLGDKDIISYAYFLKQVEYILAFRTLPIFFQTPGGAAQVAGFWSETKDQKDNIIVHKYWSDEQFIISLKLKNPADQLFLVKGFEPDSPEQVVDQINVHEESQEKPLTEKESFHMPVIKLKQQRNYEEMIGKNLRNKGFEENFIQIMTENISFMMDEKGARVEAEAMIMVPLCIVEKRLFTLNKPFWVIMKRRGSSNPYLIIHVLNKEVLVEV